jgi:bacteriorhodopsin
MPEMTIGQYQTVYNLLSMAIACMSASFVYFVLVRNEVSERYRTAITVSALVVFIAGYHYFRIFNSWEAAYTLAGGNGNYVATGTPFNLAYRYVDWILTVPLLMVELILVLGLSRKETNSLLFKLVIAAFLMIALGYPGEIDKTSTSIFSARGLWGLLSTVPFVYLLVNLLGQLKAAMARTRSDIAVLLRNTGLLTLLAWGFYPIAYMAPFYGATGSNGEVFLQVGYSLADIIAKCGYGLMIHRIAVLRTEAEAKGEEPVPQD